MFWNSGKKDPQTYPGYPQLPPPLRVGAIVSLEQGEILRYDGLGLTLPLPQGDMVVEAVSGMELFGLRVSRAYVKTGGRQALFQFQQDKAGTLLDVNCFQVFEEIFPGSEADWGLWLGEGGLIGGADLNAPNGRSYSRDWGQGAYAAPVEAVERIFTDPAQAPIEVPHKMMLYSRELSPDAQEYMLLSVDEEPGQVLVRCLSGVVMSPQALKIF
ncbi:hypothetical protein NNJEOMEG_00849 [Fundidesulfovibrio magnetotacticus]|uniref:DUF2491 family protein n=1 Tax=Fundidesulfovibrio magnetotacticus TaxID=2730080 RepID=A0A6V8LPU8_9BACT|nr:DUF2491 family protein [Fundidesulfovibrio magnetotacticus]GFK93020.1 hypothetical protein NNJEOMEG_00849 [Fundidesulfovibrio magnetotacticus]